MQLLPMLAMPVVISVARIMVRLIGHQLVLDVRVNLNAVLFACCYRFLNAPQLYLYVNCIATRAAVKI